MNGICSRVLVLMTLAIGVLGVSRAQAIPIPMELFREVRPRVLPPPEIPREMNGSVRNWVHFFSVSDHPRFDRFMSRGALYRTMVQEVLVENGVPAELYYLAMIESGFARGARSSAKAVGVWQFIAPTARRYGLRVDKEIDERLDIIRGTRAAARYLKSLKHEFGSWHLAMAAYNCGENCVRRAVRRGHTRDFWQLARMRLLPAETINYIPKFHAAMLIARAPEVYGFGHKIYYEFPEIRSLRVIGAMPLSEIARRKHVSFETLVALNPHLVRRQTPRAGRGYEVWLPRTGPARIAHRSVAAND
jgi:membrane-bound lytic murein transglycosylase D